MEMAAGLLSGREKRLSSGAWVALGQKTGFSLRESLGAIEKLITYVGKKAVIEAADVEAVIGRTKEDTVFDLTGALSGRNLTVALRTLKDLLDQGSPPLMIFSMITREIRFLLQAKLLLASGRMKAFSANADYGRFQKSVYPSLKQGAGEGEEQVDLVSQHPFVVYQALKNAGRFTRSELAGYLEMLAGIDLALKSTGRSPPAAGALPARRLQGECTISLAQSSGHPFPRNGCRISLMKEPSSVRRKTVKTGPLLFHQVQPAAGG